MLSALKIAWPEKKELKKLQASSSKLQA